MTLKDWHDRLHGNFSGLAATRKACGRELPILDRLVHNAHRIEMRGDSMRKKRAL